MRKPETLRKNKIRLPINKKPVLKPFDSRKDFKINIKAVIKTNKRVTGIIFLSITSISC